MTNKKTFAIRNSIKSPDVKEIRRKLNVTQKEFANLINSSIKTVEKWEMSDMEIKGPIVTLIKMLNIYPEFIMNFRIHDNKYPLRLWYMFKDEICTIIDVDEKNGKVEIYNYTNDLIFRAFGHNEYPNYEEYQGFIESRCFPKSRDNLKTYLRELDIPFYEPLMIIEKTLGRMADDEFWIRMERHNSYDKTEK
ncbi:MAG: putative transcriptional [Erysipelotrichaceae bacterium]|nr:MAG: putative transcriptional [Erysipelotrichaceae bacterium]